MDEKKEFYIGWQDTMPRTNRIFLKTGLISLFLLIPVLTLLVVSFQKPFNTHRFELGSIKEFTGVYREKPVPVLEVPPEALPREFSNHILLVGYGKFGAEGVMKAITKEKGTIEGRKITVRGTLIYGDGKTLLELTEKANSIVAVHEQADKPKILKKDPKTVRLTGEILDPKCYFGVMKPGEGKIHKSCAIRCISGGIPPVFRVAAGMHEFEYYIVLGPAGEKINKAVLPFVARTIAVSGNVSRENGWNIIRINPKDIAVTH